MEIVVEVYWPEALWVGEGKIVDKSSCHLSSPDAFGRQPWKVLSVPRTTMCVR